MASWHRVVIFRFLGPPGIAALQRVRDAQRCQVEVCGGKVALLSLIEPRVGLNFDEDTRRIARKLHQEMREDILVSAQIVLKSGFFASIVRSIMFGVQSVAKSSYPTKLCSTLEEAVGFITPVLREHGEAVTEHGLSEAVLDFARKVGAKLGTSPDATG